MSSENGGGSFQVAEAEEKTAGGLYLTDASKEKPSIGTVSHILKTLPQLIVVYMIFPKTLIWLIGRIQVIAAGPGPLDEEGNRKPLSIAPGNTVLYSKYAGNDFKGSDGSEYIALRAPEVMAVLS